VGSFEAVEDQVEAGIASLFLVTALDVVAALALWLVIRGRRITVSQPVLRAEPTGAAR
jgi:hypothetical protein